MAIRGYNSYRGRRNPGKVIGAIALAVVILACVGYLVAQNYIVYDDAGKAHFELPFHNKKETPQEDTVTIPDEDVQIEYVQPESPLHQVQALHATQLYDGALRQPPAEVIEQADEAVIVETKRINGSITYTTAVNVPGQVYVEKYDTMDNLKSILMYDGNAVARISVFCDSYFVRAYHDAAFQLASGSFWYDDGGWTWLDPASPQVLTYITSLCQEYADLGFSEILLDYYSYPLAGRLDAINIDPDTDRAQVLRDFTGVLKAALPEDMLLSVVVRAPLGADTGLTADIVETCFDRVYVAPGLDVGTVLSGLSNEYRSTEGRVVPMTYTKPAGGSYALVPVQ